MIDIIKNISYHKLFRVRQRYLLTRTNRLRARYGVMALAMGVLLSGLSLQSYNNSAVSGLHPYEELAALEPASGVQTGKTVDISETMEMPAPAAETASYASVLPENLIDLVRISKEELQPAAAESRNKDYVIKSGQTVAGILQDAGIGSGDSYKIVKALGKHVDMRRIQAGQSFQVMMEPEKNDAGEAVLAEMVMDVDSLKSVSITKDGDDFNVDVTEKETVKQVYAGMTEIQTSLYGSAARSGIPSQVIAKMIRMYSLSVDFQRDIRRDDKIEVLYDVEETEDGDTIKYGEILYANLSIGGKQMPLYRYEKKDGTSGYYDEKGSSIKKTLMKTPVDGARVSSGYGMRKHPILGYGKMHKGVDFAAPIGTPVYAAGDGVLEKVGRNGAYGNYVSIRHNSTLKTAYAHLHKFAKGISPGKRVKQGQVIAYIGTTGRSTGPHLHYEVLLNNDHVNPNRVDLPIGENLAGEDLKRFKKLVADVNKKYKDLLNGQKFAESTQNDKEKDKKKVG